MNTLFDYGSNNTARCSFFLDSLANSNSSLLSTETQAFLSSYFSSSYKIIKVNIANERLWNQDVLIVRDHGDSFYDVLIDSDDKQAMGVVFKQDEDDEWYMAFAPFQKAHTYPGGYNPLMISPVVKMRNMFGEARRRYLKGAEMFKFFQEEDFYLY